MQMRRGWAGLALVVGVVTLAGCDKDLAPGPIEKGISEDAFVEDTLPEVAALTCPAVRGVAARSDTFVILADSSRVVHLEGGGRDHSLWIWSDDVPTRTVVISEMLGTRNGVDIDITPDPANPSTPWALLTLDAGDCRSGPTPFIVRRHEDGVFTLPDGGFDESTSTAFAVLRGNSGYMLAAPTKGPPPPDLP